MSGIQAKNKRIFVRCFAHHSSYLMIVFAMKKYIGLFVFIALIISVRAQIFSGAGGAITDNGQTILFPMQVSNLQHEELSATFGVVAAAFNITHSHVGDLEIYLMSPGGKTIALSLQNGSDGDNYSYTKFTDKATEHISNGWAPFSGQWLPEERLGEFNNGQNGNGLWNLVLRDVAANNQSGTLLGWSLTFGADASAPLEFSSSNLPIVIVDTYGQNIPDEPKILVGMKIIDNGPGQRNYITDTPAYDGFAGFEIRGSSSQQFPKKSYGIETWDADGQDIKVSLLGMPKESDWILNANYSDKTLMRNTLAYQLFQKMGHYATRYRHVELMLNNSYRGVYIFSEKIKRDKDRVNIAKITETNNSGDSLTGGYIVKIDKSTGSGGAGWTSSYPPPSHPYNQTIFFQYEYPKYDKISPQQKAYISNYVNTFETTLKGPFFDQLENGWRKYADEYSFIDYFLVNEISKNVDGYRLSTFIHKERESLGGKLRMGPVWDYDIAFRNANYCGGDAVTGWAYQFPCSYDSWQVPFWWQRLLQDNLYADHLKCRWIELRENKLSNQWFEQYIDSLATLLDEGQARNFVKWPILGIYVWPNPQPIPTSYAGEINALKNYLNNRLSWLDNNLPGYCNPNQLNESRNTGQELRVYPNPATDWIEIETITPFDNSVEISVLDATGKTFARFDGRSLRTADNSFRVNLKNLSSGIWILRFADKQHSIHRRLVISR